MFVTWIVASDSYLHDSGGDVVGCLGRAVVGAGDGPGSRRRVLTVVTAVTSICSLSILIVSPFWTDVVPPVLVTWIVVSANDLVDDLADGVGGLGGAVDARGSRSGSRDRCRLTLVTVICSFSIWIVSPL